MGGRKATGGKGHYYFFPDIFGLSENSMKSFIIFMISLIEKRNVVII